MNTTPSRIISTGVLALLVTSTWAGSAAATTEPPVTADAMTDVSSAPADIAPGCAEIVTLLDTQLALFTAYLEEDGAALAAVLGSLPDVASAAQAAAPADIADAVDAFVEPVADFEMFLEGVDLTDFAAVGAALSSIPPDEASDTAQEDLEAWATEICGWIALDPFADAPEPPECDVLDPAIAADAAGIEVNVTDSDGGGDVGLPGYRQKSCSYGNGAMSLSTISYNDIEQATQFFADNLVDAEGNPGEFIDVDLGGLPASTLVANVGGATSVSVLEATIPFAVAFTGDDIDPAAVVAAAEALYATLPAEPPPPPTTEPMLDGTMAVETTTA